MPGLIPLMLNPAAAGNRASVTNVLYTSPTTSTATTPSSFKRHSRGQSLNQLPRPALSSRSSSPSGSPVAGHRASMPAMPRQKPVKRLSFVLPPPNLPVLPFTPADWRKTIAEVKRQHVNRRYRACFTRCDEILNNVKVTSDVEPAYLISLHFYGATSLEMCARPLSAASAYREKLLHQARTHYDQAAVLIQHAEETMASRSRPSSAMSSMSSLHSPSSSISSQVWSSATSLSSPAPSVCSSDDLTAQSPQSEIHTSALQEHRPARKKVSFELPKEDRPELEPFIRPDSPTLGFDDVYFTGAFSRQALPDVPEKRPASPEASELVEDDDTTPTTLKPNPLEQGACDSEHDHIRDSFLMMSGSVSRYCAHLASLKAQLALHRADLSSLLETPTSGDNALLLIQTTAPETSDEMRNLEKQARIERLRKSGWQRKRFNPSRYEALCNAVLADL